MSISTKHINPLLRSIDDIDDFSDVSAVSEIEKEEFPNIEKIVHIIISEIRNQSRKLTLFEKELEDQIAIIEDETGDDKASAVGVYNKIFQKVKLIVKRINRELDVVDAPYFGKVKLVRDAISRYPKTEISSYIGKFAYFDDESKAMLVTDWRAPIANIYYTNSGPTKNISFESPIGKMTGELLQKRQFDISNGRIRSIYDTKSGNASADEFLLSQLNKRLGKKLADIVATIQSQQNEIIRGDVNQPVILQGVAGSGKTTIVLHRLAYIFYAFSELIKPEKSLIIAPNRMFLDYISAVLPSLGITGVESTTFIFWAKKVLKLKESTTISQTTTNLSAKAYKGSEQFLSKLEDFFTEYEKDLVDNIPFSESALFASKYWKMKEEHSDIQMIERFNLCLNATYLSIDVANRLSLSSKQMSDTTKDRVKKYIEEKTNYRNIYIEFINNEKYNSKDISNYTSKTLTRNTIAHDDLPPLLWVFFQLNGYSEFIKDYIVVDEAQDMSPFEIYILSLISKRNNLFLAGDIAQSIIPPFQIQSWDVVRSIVEKRKDVKFQYFQLNKCYRTTIEIIEYANNILRNYFPKSYELPEAVLRHGDNVEEITYDQLIETINTQFEEGSATVALICKDENGANKLYDRLMLSASEISRPIYTYSDSDYKTGVLVLPVNKAKGLEFDSVVLVDTNGYNMEEQSDSRLFYVAVTRALHRLFLLK